jgi:hypothetical protein
VTEPGRSDELGGPGPHPTFQLVAAVAASSLARPLAAWVDSVRRARNAAVGEEAQLGAAEPDSAGGQPALRLEPYCGDCEARELYVASGQRVVSLSYELGIHLAGTRDEQERAHRRVLQSFRWAP